MHNIVYKRLHEEKKDSDFTAADHWVTNVLPNLLETYQPQDIYNADETGLALPDLWRFRSGFEFDSYWVRMSSFLELMRQI
jgi:hypothetical protein